ncbi:hypothetical protein A0H81_09517 [Grifola frondosa]|uniref:Uncharacterized protein n=1 Tax=Grifola frondosa TaxID=5627 RepID=A0A1C7M277_GRIFR|nr:hypothetical protein A0H81_09517 [Grifola frondosa]
MRKNLGLPTHSFFSPSVTGGSFSIRSGPAKELNLFILGSPHLHGAGAPEEPNPVHVGSPPPSHTVNGAEQCNSPDHQLSDDMHMEELHGLQVQLNVGKAAPILNGFFWVLSSGSHLMIQQEPGMVESHVLWFEDQPSEKCNRPEYADNGLDLV